MSLHVQWRGVTATQPTPLEDVLVSALVPGEDQPQVYQAWRSHSDPQRFVLTGTETPVPGLVYAFAKEPAPAVVPAELQVLTL